jgi:two-component system cell cycle response regulator
MTTKIRILVVDDDAFARQLYLDCLAGAGHEVRAVSDANEAAAALDAESFDIVVTDLILPSQDGLAVLDNAKQRDPGIEVIVITAVDRVDPAVRALKSGAADYLVKPVPPESLLLSVSRCVASRQLLKENATLRQHLSLVEAGQRLATTLDRESLFPMALHSLREVLSARFGLLLARRDDGGLALVAHEGMDAVRAGALAAEASEPLRALGSGFDEVEVAGERLRAILAEDAGEVLGACLLESTPSPGASALSNASFLARHLALALRNLRRLSAAEDLAFRDDLTRLYNLRYLHVVLDREIQNSKQTGAPFSVLFIDLDHFKAINDTHGHMAGSRLLVEMGGVLKNSVRDFDIATRYGGDEYVIVLLNTDTGGALKVAERIRRTLEEHRFLARDGISASLTACIGVASYPEHAQDKQHILDCADRAMYRGKQSTRNIIYVASPADPAARTA